MMKNIHYGILLCLAARLSFPAWAGFNPQVVLQTTAGTIVVELYPEAAPITVDNFLHYVNSGFYDGLLFHRSETRDRISGLNTGDLDVIQAGACFYYDGQFYFPTPGSPITNESYNGLSNLRGTIAMARSFDPHSATAQFYINHQDNTGLDRMNYWDGYGYCVFGKIVEGMDVVDAIASAPIVDLPTLNPDWPPYHFFPNPLIWTFEAAVQPCGASYCMSMNGSSSINFQDFAVFASGWLDACGSGDAFCGGRDLTYDGVVDVADLELFLVHWHRTAGWEPQFSDLVPDGVMGPDDLAGLLMRWLDTDCDSSNAFCGGGDIDRDGTVNWVDFSLFSGHWLASY